MPWEQNLYRMMGKAVGISFRNGQGTSGILCDADNDMVYITEHLYREQFATKQYALNTIHEIVPFPPCQRRSPSQRIERRRMNPKRRMF